MGISEVKIELIKNTAIWRLIMDNPTVISMIQNAALLLILSIIYEVTYYIPESKKGIRPYLNGAFVAAICVAIMMIPFRMEGGIVFDTRSILISVTGYIFGFIPTAITVIVASIYRLYMGGLGAVPGVIVILTSAIIGLFWRRDPLKLNKTSTWLNILIMSITVHLGMLLAMMLLPYPTNLQVVSSISLPVLTIYPIGTLVLALLLNRQKDLRDYQKKLKHSEEKYQALFDEAPLPYQSLDIEGYIADVNKQWLDMMGYNTKEDVLGTWFPKYLDDTGGSNFVERFSEFKRAGRIVSELVMISKNGECINVSIEGRINHNIDGSFKNTHCIVRDITEKKKAEEKLVYISYHDYLTGLSNRRFFEEELVRLDSEDNLPLSVLMGDINGLKLINDTLGHSFGDILITETSKILISCMKEKYLLSRTGGDEFTVLMPRTAYNEARELINKLHVGMSEYNKKTKDEVITINLSLGVATKERADQNISETIRDAEYNMYQRKLLEKKSSHSSIISSMQATMIEKSHETEAHARRLAAMARKIGEELSLSQLEMDQLELLSMLHDIGKVAVPDRILNKPDKLTPEEWSEMRKHPEVGYRIASSSPELSPIAEYILCHHERWDGKGYPQGLAGEEIPLLSRILSIVDAYDAMTEDRAYRKAMGKKEAISEIRENSGTQFDPRIASIFVEEVLGTSCKQ